jgi:hypothetical protein
MTFLHIKYNIEVNQYTFFKNEKYIKSGYISDFSDWKDVKELGKTVNNKIYFSGGAYTDGEDWVSIHTAIESAKNKVNEIMFSN